MYRWNHCLRILSIFLLASTCATVLCQESPPASGVQLLELKKAVEREIAKGEIHSYGVQGIAGQVIDAVVDQRGVDLVVEVLAPDGKQIAEIDSPNGDQGPEQVLLIAENTGMYVLRLRALEKDTAGRYTVTFKDRRIPTDQDRKHFDDVAKLTEAQRIENQWYPLYTSGHYAEAIPLAERVLTIRRGVLGPNHPDVARTLNSLASLYQDNQEFARAESLFLQSIAIDETVFGTEHPNLAIAYGNLATLYFDMGDYEKSEVLLKKALALREKAFGAEHPDVALTLHNLARLYQAKGDLVGAEQFCRRALEIYQKVRAADHPDIARSLDTLAELYRARGDFAHAEPLYQQALAIYRKWGSRGEFWAATVTTDYATMQMELGNYDKAVQLFESALGTYEKALGKEHNDVAQVLNNLAVTYDSKGEYDRAEELHQRSLAIRKKLFGQNSLQYAESINNLAQIYWHKHNYELARSFLQQALSIWEKNLGLNHPDVAIGYSNLAIQQSEMGDIAGAVKSLRRVNDIQEHNLKLILATGSEEQKQIYLNTLSGNAEYTVSLNVRYARDDEEASKLALTSILERKGRALDAMSNQIGVLRRRATPEDGALLDRLAKVRSQLSTLQLSVNAKLKPEERAAEISKLEIENENIESNVSKRSEEFRAQFQNIDIEAVQRALPAGSALVEFVLFRAFDVGRRGMIGEQYAAYVLRSDSATPVLVSLGPADIIDEQIQRWRGALSNPKGPDPKPIGRSLDEKLMQPVRRVLGPLHHLFVSPDGPLNLIPFAALVDESNRYLIENYSITYLTSGRDLLRLQTPRREQSSEIVIVADPSFDLASPQGNQSLAITAQSQTSKRSVDFTSFDYRPLPGTAVEATALRKLWPTATVWTGAKANEAAVKEIRNPQILHIATHGFFLPKETGPNKSTEPTGSPTDRTNRENPLLRSGLILAGVKQQASGEGQDGVLTALEMAGLNLWGTKLVVLSACETGIGDVKRGEGVYGLRRALVLAGSESQVISLWKVSDGGTRDLITNYYQRLQGLEGRTEALRQVQLMMLQGQLNPASVSGNRGTSDTSENTIRTDYRHPYYWAAFIQSGDWRNMLGK